MVASPRTGDGVVDEYSLPSNAEMASHPSQLLSLGRDSGFLETGQIFTADSSDRRQQRVGRFILRNESIHHVQCGFWNRVVTGKHHYWHLWLEALYFGRKLKTIHFRHVVVDDHGSNLADYRNF